MGSFYLGTYATIYFMPVLEIKILLGISAGFFIYSCFGFAKDRKVEWKDITIGKIYWGILAFYAWLLICSWTKFSISHLYQICGWIKFSISNLFSLTENAK
jgi:hypothetical protein